MHKLQLITANCDWFSGGKLVKPRKRDYPTWEHSFLSTIALLAWVTAALVAMAKFLVAFSSSFGDGHYGLNFKILTEKNMV